MLLLIDLPTFQKRQKESKDHWDYSAIKELGNIVLHAKEEIGHILVPISLQKDLTSLCHQNLKRPSGDRMHLATKEMICWKGVKNALKNTQKHAEHANCANYLCAIKEIYH